MSLTLPTVTGYSPFWELTGDRVPYAMIPRSQQGSRSPIERQLARLLARPQLRDLRAAMVALNGAAAGETATSTFKRVPNPTNPSLSTPQVTNFDDIQGNRTPETITAINRATTAADEAYIDDLLDNDLISAAFAGESYPTVVGSGGPTYAFYQGVPSI